MTLGGGDLALKKALGAALEQGSRDVLLNLSELSYADSAGLGEIANCFKTVSARGGRFMVCEAQPKVRKLLNATGLDQIFDVHESEAAALAAF